MTDWWGFAAAAVAAIVAIWQATIARGARKDAETAKDAAEEHERNALKAATDAASAATRSADAHERMAAVAEASTEKPAWKLSRKGDAVWRLRNVSGHALEAMVVSTDSRVQVLGGYDWRTVGPRGDFEIAWEFSLGQQPWVEVSVMWADADTGTDRSKAFTLEWRPPQSLVY